MAVERFQESNWCCFFTANPIGVKSGSNVLIHKPEVQTGCLFGFDPETKCAECLPNRRYNAIELVFVSSGLPYNGVFMDIILSGDLCTQIGGIFCYGYLAIGNFTSCKHNLIQKLQREIQNLKILILKYIFLKLI